MNTLRAVRCNTLDPGCNTLRIEVLNDSGFVSLRAGRDTAAVVFFEMTEEDFRLIAKKCTEHANRLKKAEGE